MSALSYAHRVILCCLSWQRRVMHVLLCQAAGRLQHSEVMSLMHTEEGCAAQALR